jgi:sec-independent protein translocase protein TatB
MFDLDIGKMLVFCVVALVVVGPKDLPRVLRAAGRILAKAKRFRDQLGTAVTRFADEADVGSIDKEFTTAASRARVDFALDPAMTMRGRAATDPSLDAAPRDREDWPARYASKEMAAYMEPMPEPTALAPAGELHDESRALEARTA